MRLEIEQIPAHEKQALLDAQSKCKEEFTDARLSVFLKSEGMNAEASYFVLFSFLMITYSLLTNSLISHLSSSVSISESS
jgi:hypothetical protein